MDNVNIINNNNFIDYDNSDNKNRYNIKKIRDKNNTLQYIIQSAKTSHDAFSIDMIGSTNKNHKMLSIIPHITKK